jgi:hypothetical protein
MEPKNVGCGGRFYKAFGVKALMNDTARLYLYYYFNLYRPTVSCRMNSYWKFLDRKFTLRSTAKYTYYNKNNFSLMGRKAHLNKTSQLSELN